MKLTVKVDAQFFNLKDSEIANMRERFGVQERLRQGGTKVIHVWLSSEEKTVDDVDLEIQDFLTALRKCGFEKRSENSLRLAIFYDVNETIVFPFSISAATVQLLADCGMSLKTVGYPCSDDQPAVDDYPERH